MVVSPGVGYLHIHSAARWCILAICMYVGWTNNYYVHHSIPMSSNLSTLPIYIYVATVVTRSVKLYCTTLSQSQNCYQLLILWCIKIICLYRHIQSYLIWLQWGFIVFFHACGTDNDVRILDLLAAWSVPHIVRWLCNMRRHDVKKLTIFSWNSSQLSSMIADVMWCS